MNNPFSAALMILFVVVCFAAFGIMVGTETEIDSSGYSIPTNSSYDSLGVLSDLSIFDLLGSITDITTGNDLIDKIIFAFFGGLIAIIVAWFARASN